MREKKCCAKKKKKKKKEKPPITAEHWLGFVRKCCAGGIFLLHPLVANTAFEAVHCVTLDTQWVLASAPTIPCDGDEQIRAYTIAWVSIVVSIFGFPLFALSMLSRSAGWCGKWSHARARELRAAERLIDDAAQGVAVNVMNDGVGDGGDVSDDALHDDSSRGGESGKDSDGDVPMEDALPNSLKGPGPVSGGLLCCIPGLVECLHRARASLDAVHDEVKSPGLFYAWTSLLTSDYKPEFFFVRIFFYFSTTAIAFANTFLNPDNMENADAWTADLLVAAQIVRFSVAAVAVTVPCVFLILLLPMKRSSRWKLPLRLACAIVSVTLLLFNVASWRSERLAKNNENDRLDLEWFAYVALIMSLGLIVLMAALFVVFVVFRGAQLQKQLEDADAAKIAERELTEAIAAHLKERRRVRLFVLWRARAVQSRRKRLEGDVAHPSAAQPSSENERPPAEHGTPCSSLAAGNRAGGVTKRSPMHEHSDDVAQGADDAAPRERDDNAPGLDKSDDAASDAHNEHVDDSAPLELSVDASPRELLDGDPASLPGGWSAEYDADAESVYYHNVATGESQWEKPSAVVSGDEELEEDG